MISKYILRQFLYYLVTGILISGLAFVNHYPLVYSDSGAYMLNSFRLYQFDDRPIGYGLIIRAVTWQSTMWTVVVFQGAVASWLLMLVVRETITDASRWVRVHLILLALLILCSSLPWYSAQLMADHFTPLVLLISFLLFRGQRLGIWREVFLWIFLFFFLATHNAHLLMAAALSGIVLWNALLSRSSRRHRSFWIRWYAFIATIGGAAAMIMLFNYAAHGRMQLSRAGNVFMAGRLCEPGIMADYLEKSCPTKDCPLCKYKDHLTLDAGGILWNDQGYVQQEHITIGAADSLLAPVVSDILKDPEYLARYARSAVVSTFVQLFQWDAGTGLEKYGIGSSPYHSLDMKIPDEVYSYLQSRQQWGYWDDRKDANRIGAIALVLSILVILLYSAGNGKEAQPTSVQKLARWSLAWIVLNAAVTSSLSVVDSRLQSRVLWLLPMAAFLWIAQQRTWREFFQSTPRGAGH